MRLAQAEPLVKRAKITQAAMWPKKKKNVETKKHKRCDRRSGEASAEAPWGAFGTRGKETVAKVMAASALPLVGTEGARLLTPCRTAL